MNAAAPAAPMSAGSLAQLTLSLLMIVGLILALAWILKRFRVAAPRGRGAMCVVDEVAVGPRERVVLVRIGDAQVLVGVGAGGLVPLTPLSTPIALDPGAAAAPFADRLREFMKRPGGNP